MPLSICDSSQKKRQAIQEKREKKRRRQSLPLTIESTTHVNPEKVQKRRLSRRLSKSDLLNNVASQKGNDPEQATRPNSMNLADKENGHNQNAIQGPTPYWKIVAERGGQMSPRQTRSATKKQRDTRPPLPTREGAKALFGSPDDKAKHEKGGDAHEGESLYEFSFPPRDRSEDASDLTPDTSPTRRRSSFLKDQNLGLEAAFAHIKTLENEKVELVEQLATLRQKYQSTTEELESLQGQAGTKMQGFSAASERVEQERKEFVEKDHQKAIQIEKLKGEVQRLEEKLHFVENKQIPDLEGQLESVNASVQKEQESSHGLKSQLEEVHHEIQEKSLEMKSLEAQCKQLESELSSLAKENEELQKQSEKLETESKNLNSEKETLKKKLDLLETEQLSEAESKYKEALFKLQQEQEHAAHVDSELKSLKAEADALRSALSKTSSEWASEKSKMIEEMEGIEKETESLKEEIKIQSEKHNSQLNELMRQLESIQGEYNHIKNDTLPQKEAEIESLRACVEKQKAVESELLSGNQAMQAQINRLEQQVQSSRNERDEIGLFLNQARAELEGLQTDLSSKGSSLDAADNENNTLREKLKSQNEAFAYRLQELEQLLQQERQERQDLMKEKENISLDAARTDERLLSVENQLRETIRERDEANHYMATFGDREQELHQRLMESDHIRRELHSKVMTLMGNIRVFVRCRPRTTEERDTSTKEEGAVFRFPSPSENNSQLENDYKKAIELIEPKKDRGGLKPRTKKHQFSFDHVFEQDQGQNEVWEATEPLVQSAVDGHRVTLFAYGQTGSGKTYTMLGEPGNEGIVTRSIHKIFSNKRRIEADTKGKASVKITVELLEIYNEEVRDLLTKDKGSSKKNVRISMANQTVEGNKVVPIGSEDECMKLLEIAQSRRCVKSTSSNAKSSRSHLVFTIHFTVQGEGVVERKGKLNVCDLAGSERLSKSEAHFVGGALLKETQNINKSLSTLSNVIEQLQAGSKSIAYRESKLTSLLCDSLGGNSKTLAIVCVSPLASHYHESLSSLRFAEKSSKVELKAASKLSV